MTAFPLQKTLAAVIAVANAPESAHGFYKTSARDLAKTLGYEPDKLMKIGYGTRPVTTTHESVVSPLEYPTKLADASYSGISHNGSGRSKMDRDSYVETVQRLYDEAIEKVETEAQRAAVLEAVDKFKREYLKRERQVIAVRSNTYSGYVAGRSKLNARQANAGNDRLSKALNDFYDWVKRASPSIMQAVIDSRSPEQIEAARQAAEEKRIAKERRFDDVMVRLLNFRDGDDFKLGDYMVAKVGTTKDGIPKTVTFKSGQGLYDNKMDLVGARSLWPTEQALKASYDRAMASGQVVEREKPKAKPKKAAKADEVPPPGALTMTMDEWKNTHRDFKSIIDGQRMAIRDGVLKRVYIVKPEVAATPPQASDFPNAASYHAALADFRKANTPAPRADTEQASSDRRAEIKRELAVLEKQYKQRMNKDSGVVPPSIKSDALNSIARKMDSLDAELKALNAEKGSEKSVAPIKTEATISDSDYAQVVEAARYLKDIVYSLQNLIGDDSRLLVELSSELGKSGRDTILMDAFGIDRNLAHTIHNRLDDSKPHKLRAVDMEDAFATFPMLKTVIDNAKEELRLREERRAARIASNMKPAASAGFDSIDAAAHEAATSPRNYLPEPTDGQKLAGSYKMGRIRISGVDIAIENPQGSIRSGIGFDGQRWANTMQHHYGYINGSTGADGDHIDVFVQPGLSDDYDGPVYVIDQIDPETGDFDEHKVIIGATSLQQAKAMYLSNYDAGWQGCGDVTMMTWPEFREWIASGDTTGPVGEAIEMGYDAARFDDIRIGGGLSSMLEAITDFDGDGKKAISLASMLGIRPSELSNGRPLDEEIVDFRSEDYFHAARMSDYKAKLKEEERTKSGFLKSNGYVVAPNEDFFELRTNANPYTFRMVDKKTRKPFRFSSEQDAADFAKRLPRGSKVQSPLIDNPDDDGPAQNEQLVSDAAGDDVDMFGDPIQPPEGMGEDLFGDDTEMPAHLPIDEIPVHEIGLSADVPQFKSGADDETGVVEPLGGKFDRTGVAPIQLWKRRNGRYEVISGRHRLDLARRSGEKTIPSQVHHEDRGFDARRAAMLDAELNIRDGQGKVRDYIDYFTHSGITEAEAEAKGLIARHIGQRAFAIATQGSEDLIAAHKAEIISDQAAADIAGLAPGNAAMQAVGIRAIQEGKPIQTAVNTMRAVMALARESGQVADTMDLFGFDDSALREAEAMAKLASRKQRQVGEQLAAIKGAAKRPELARKQGVAVDDPEAVRNRVVELTALKQRWDNWSSHSDLLAEIRAEISKPGFDSLNADEHETPDDGYWFWMESLAA